MGLSVAVWFSVSLFCVDFSLVKSGVTGKTRESSIRFNNFAMTIIIIIEGYRRQYPFCYSSAVCAQLQRPVTESNFEKLLLGLENIQKEKKTSILNATTQYGANRDLLYKRFFVCLSKRGLPPAITIYFVDFSREFSKISNMFFFWGGVERFVV